MVVVGGGGGGVRDKQAPTSPGDCINLCADRTRWRREEVEEKWRGGGKMRWRKEEIAE